MSQHPLIVVALGLLLALAPVTRASEPEARQLLATIILSEGEERDAAIDSLSFHGDSIIKTVIEGWKVGQVSTVTPPGLDQPIALLKAGDGFEEIATGEPYTRGGEPVISRASRSLRKTLRAVVELLDLESADPSLRIATVQRMGLSQKAEFLPFLRERFDRQDDPKVRLAFEESIGILTLSTGTEDERLKAVQRLGELRSFPARDLIESLRTEEDGDPELVEAAIEALVLIDRRQGRAEVLGTLFRGLSLGSVLLLVAYGLAITFGLMGVINMAHGEFIAIGAYSVYLVQGFFARMFGEGSSGAELYFLAALPASFLTAGLMGVLLERGVIRFLYRRPLESLLATWGVSMILQQLFRFQFGAANVSVSSPSWLSGSLELAGVAMSYSRLFVIGFALLVILGTWLLLARTSWGLHVRATMQNRTMAGCLGVRSARVNMLTFGFGSGLAGLAGAFLSQIGNVGPSMGQGYIVDSFMVVVIGGVGNLVGTALSSLGIGMVDQILQPLLGPVMGKITVLFAIILFLQFRPGGLFPARTRALED